LLRETCFTIPEKFTAKVLDDLDDAIKTSLGADHLITQDAVCGEYKTLSTDLGLSLFIHDRQRRSGERDIRRVVAFWAEQFKPLFTIPAAYYIAFT